MVVEDADTDTDVTEIDIVEEDVTNIEDVPDVIAVDIVGEREKDVEDAPDVIQIDIVGESEPTTDAGAAGEVVHGREDADVRGEEAVIPVQQDPIAPVPDPATDVGGTIGDTGVVVQVIGDGLGGIIIRKHVCEDEASAQAGGWFATCTPGDAGTPFRLRTLDTVPATLPRVGTTDAGGVVRFDRLPVGRYHLAEMSGGWCHAKADGVNAAGEIVIEGGQSTTVSIVNCGAPPE